MRLHPYLEYGGLIAFAHRGGALEQPENSMRAFEAAIALGYTFLETDVQVTADGVAVAFHDDTLDRVTDLRGPVAHRTYSDICAARISGTEPIPRLDELISAWPQARFNIDIKCDRAIEPLSKLIRDLRCIDRVCLASRTVGRLAPLREIWGDKLCTALTPGEARRLCLSALGFPTGKIDGRCAQVPERWVVGGLSVWSAGDAFLRGAHLHSIPVHVWTVNEPASMARFIELGVDGIMTDRPSTLKALLSDRGLWWQYESLKAPSRRRESLAP